MTARIIVTDGPYRLDGAEGVSVQAGSPRTGLADADLSNALDGSGTAWLCRCGASTLKPACDGNHESCAGFDGADSPTPLHTWPAGGASPALVLTPGSAIEVENVDVELQDGTVLDMSGKGCVLCRCGASETKPGCDGTCRSIGFEG